jgi:ABC-type sulfate/molybdate transport systems ATPase subunit
MVEPALLLLDEPLSALDAGARRAQRGFLAEHLARSGRPALVVTHDPRDIRALDADVVAIEAGRVVQTGRVEAIAARPSTAFLAELFDGLGAGTG